MTSSNGNIFRVTGPLFGNTPVTDEFPSQRPVTRGFDVFFDPRLNKQLSKQSWGWWFELPSRPLWRHCIDFRDRGWVSRIQFSIHIYTAGRLSRSTLVYYHRTNAHDAIAALYIYIYIYIHEWIYTAIWVFGYHDLGQIHCVSFIEEFTGNWRLSSSKWQY